MEPEVRYCMTADGVRIAYTITGEGPPLVLCVDPIASHTQLEWSHPTSRLIQRQLIRTNTLIRFDLRGCGLSDRVMPQTLDDYVLDIEAVVERAGLRQFALNCILTTTLPAIVFAGRHPERITRMLITDGFLRVADPLSTPQGQALLAAAKVDWTLATEAIGFVAFGSGRDVNVSHGEYVRACVGPEYLEGLPVSASWDVSEFAGSIQVPTLVMKHAGVEFVTMEATKDLVARIPSAQLVVLEGTFVDDIEGTVRRMVAFINAGSEPTHRSPTARSEPVSGPAGTAIILFADIAGSTALTERLGDAAFRAKARDLDTALRTIIRDYTGTPIDAKTLGDGVLATFTSARQAIEAALACARSGDEAGLPLHLGLHAGDVIREDNNVFGGAVNIAARVSALAAPGEVLVSETIRSLARTSAGVSFEDRGEQAMKGVGEPLRVWAVRGAE